MAVAPKHEVNAGELVPDLQRPVGRTSRLIPVDPPVEFQTANQTRNSDANAEHISASASTKNLSGLPDAKFAKGSVWIRGDLYSPPDPVSNLPHILFQILPNESPVQKRLREMRQEFHDWNHSFWADHNRKFAKEKEQFLAQRPQSSEKISADEISVFYKDFLDRNRVVQAAYNKELYKKHFRLLWPEFMVAFQKIFRRIAR